MSRALIMLWLSLTAAWLRIEGRRVEVDSQVLDGTVQALLALMRHTGRSRAGAPSIGDMRAAYRRTPGLTGLPPDHGVDVNQLPIRPGLSGRLYTPLLAGKARLPLVLYFHGGGWIIGDLDTHDPLCRLLAVRTGMRVLSVGYRLAPEHPFPAAFDDALAAWHWARDHSGATGYVLGGDSAGGNLAAAVAVAEAAQNGARLATWLLYPALDLSLRSASAELFREGFLLTTEMAEACVGAYAPLCDLADPRLSPLRAPADVLARLGPSAVVAAGFDPLRDHATAWAAALKTAGVRVSLRTETTLVHGFADYAGVVTAARTAMEAAVDLVPGLLGHADTSARAPAFA